MELTFNDKELLFIQATLRFIGPQNITNVFAKKNNKTLKETIEQRRYAKLANLINAQYKNYLDYSLGEFLLHLKLQGDSLYKKFLNSYGDGVYCTFRLLDKRDTQMKGIYAYFVNEKLVYIGRCLNSFGKRIDSGYGQISPKNCYLDGQATNCHLNQLINLNRESIRFFYCRMTDDLEIAEIERALIRTYKPEWNIALNYGSALGYSQAHEYVNSLAIG